MPHLLPLGTTLEGLEKRQRWGWGENNSWDCSLVGLGLPETDSVKTVKNLRMWKQGKWLEVALVLGGK